MAARFCTTQCIGLPIEDVAEVRRRVLAWQTATGRSYRDISRMTGVDLSDVKRFMAGTSGPMRTDAVTAAIVIRLPLGLRFQRQRVLPW